MVMTSAIEVDDEIKPLLQPGERVQFKSMEVPLRLHGDLIGTRVYATNRRILLKHPKWAGLRVEIVDYPYKDIADIWLSKGILATSVLLKMRFSASKNTIFTIPKNDAEKLKEIVKEGIARELAR